MIIGWSLNDLISLEPLHRTRLPALFGSQVADVRLFVAADKVRTWLIVNSSHYY